MINVHITNNNVLLGQYIFIFYVLKSNNWQPLLKYELFHFALYFVSMFYKSICFIRFLVRSIFLRSFYKVLLSYALLAGNLPGQNSLRIRKSTFYFLLTCPERAHSRFNTRASRTAISIPFNVFQYPFLPFFVSSLSVQFCITYSLRSSAVLDISFFWHLSKNACC